MLVWKWDSSPFGADAADENPSGYGAFAFNVRFPGQYYDAETGLYYNWNRYYDPKTGRYVTSDPIGLEGGLNTYAYVQNNPLRFVDPRGLSGATTEDSWCSQHPVECALILGGSAQGSKSLPIPSSKSDTQKCDDDGKDDCKKASKWQLELANIFDEHDFKEGYVGGSVSRYDICACKDGSIVIKEVGQCGKPGPSIPTHGRWK